MAGEAVAVEDAATPRLLSVEVELGWGLLSRLAATGREGQQDYKGDGDRVPSQVDIIRHWGRYTEPMVEISGQDRVFVLSGAGISAESGIPTFRGAGGLWRNYRFEEVASPEAWRRAPQLVWEFYSMRRRVARAAKPNPGHFALRELERSLKDRLFLCTQNVDDLHEQAGSQRAVHMHGELFKSRCDRYDPDADLLDGRTNEGGAARCHRPPFADLETYEPPAGIPRCHCGGKIRPHICWFGEVPYHLEEISRALDDCTVFIAIGTSGLVEPAASFAARVHRRARSFYVGPEEPANASAFTKYFPGKSGDVLPLLFRLS